jgi:nucleoside-diphosphate-sugar epimerase
VKRILVTGATGFVGRHVIRPLTQRGYEVVAVGRSSLPIENVSWLTADLLNQFDCYEMLKSVKPTHLLHLGWYTRPEDYWNSLENIRWVSSSMTLIDAALRNNIGRIVAVGSCAEYDWSLSGIFSEETTPSNPRSLYGLSKLSVNRLSQDACRRAGVSFGWARLFYLFGYGEQPSRLMPMAIRQLSEGKELKVSSGNQVRDFLYVEDAAEALAALVDSRVSGVVNIGSGESLRVRDLLSILGEKLNASDLIKWGSIPTRHNEPEKIVADVTRLKREVGWSKNYDLEAGILRTITRSRGNHYSNLELMNEIID